MARFHEVFDRIAPVSSVMAADMREAGYPEAMLCDRDYHRWNEVHAWCDERFGDAYTWCGQQFFFTNEDDRMLFAMRWG